MFSNWFRSTPEPLPPMNFVRRNKILEGAASNIKLLYKFLHEHANITKQDEHLRQTRLEAMFEILDDIRSRLEETRVPQPQFAKKEFAGKIEFRRCNTDICRSTPITIPSTSSPNSPPKPLIVKLPNRLSTSSSTTPSTTPPKPFLNRRSSPSPTKEPPRKPQHFMVAPPLSPKPQKHMGTPPLSPKPQRPPPLSVPLQSPMQEANPSNPNNNDVILQENSQLKRKLAAANAARKSLENMCATIGRDNGVLSHDLARKTRELDEASETAQQLLDLNQRLYRKLSGEDVDGDISAELLERNEELMDRILKAAEEYKRIMRRVKEGMALDGAVASEMGSCIKMLSRMHNERVMEERYEITKMKKLLAKMECFLVGWQERLNDSPLKKIE